MMSRLTRVSIVPVVFLSGIAIGGCLFLDSQPRSFLELQKRRSCLSSRDLAGLMASVGIQKFPGLIPYVAPETDRIIALKLPSREGNIHHVIIPQERHQECRRDLGE